MIIAILVLAWLLTKAIHDGRVDHTYAKQGLVSPRLEAKYGTKAQAGAAIARYGFTDHVKDAMSDYWQRRTDALVAARNAKAANPGERVRLRDRLAAARAVVSPVYHRLVDPVEVKPQAVVATDPASPTGPTAEAPDVGTRRLDDDGWKQWTGTEWEPVPPVPEPATPAAGTDPAQVGPSLVVNQPTNQPTNGGTPVTTPMPTTVPTGEATDIQTAVAQAQALRLRTMAIRERILADLAQLARAVETLSASAVGMEAPPPVQGQIDRASEAVAALAAAVAGTAEEVAAAMHAVETEFAKHLPVVEQSAALGGLARKDAYAGS